MLGRYACLDAWDASAGSASRVLARLLLGSEGEPAELSTKRPPSTCEDRVLTLTIHMVRSNSLLGEGKAAIMLQHDSTTAINLKNYKAAIDSLFIW